jgi:hypothetical protein
MSTLFKGVIPALQRAGITPFAGGLAVDDLRDAEVLEPFDAEFQTVA